MKSAMLFSAYFSLFIAAFVAATVFPAQSEAVLVAMLASDAFSPAALIAVATVGNTLGAVVNWWIGGEIERFKERRWFPVSPPMLDRAALHYQKWGKWSLLFSWLPFIGDALTVIAGVMREPLMPFLVLIGIGKLARYLMVALAVWGFW